jgi:hypothetical protein
MAHQDMFKRLDKYNKHGWHKYSTTDDEGCVTGIVVATKDLTSSYANNGYVLNKAEHDGLKDAKRDGRVAHAIVVAATTNGWNEPWTYVAEIDAEDPKLTEREPRNGRHGLFYIVDEYVFGDAPF